MIDPREGCAAYLRTGADREGEGPCGERAMTVAVQERKSKSCQRLVQKDTVLEPPFEKKATI